MITLQDMLDTKTYENGLELKLELIRQKKKGYVFYPGLISEVPFDQAVEFYYYKKRSKHDDKNAFPIPINFYYKWLNHKKRAIDLLSFHKSYYKLDTVINTKNFRNAKFFIGEKYAWLYNVGDTHEITY